MVLYDYNDIYFVKVGYNIVGAVCSDNDIEAVSIVLKEFGFKGICDYEDTYPGAYVTKNSWKKLFVENDKFEKVKGWETVLFSAKLASYWFTNSDTLKSAQLTRIAISNICQENISNMYIFPYICEVREPLKLKALNYKVKPRLWYCLDWSE